MVFSAGKAHHRGVRSPEAGTRAGADRRAPPPPPRPPPARPHSRRRPRRRPWRISASFGASSLSGRTRESTRTILLPPLPLRHLSRLVFCSASSLFCITRPSPRARLVAGALIPTSPSPASSHRFLLPSLFGSVATSAVVRAPAPPRSRCRFPLSRLPSSRHFFAGVAARPSPRARSGRQVLSLASAAYPPARRRNARRLGWLPTPSPPRSCSIRELPSASRRRGRTCSRRLSSSRPSSARRSERTTSGIRSSHPWTAFRPMLFRLSRRAT